MGCLSGFLFAYTINLEIRTRDPAGNNLVYPDHGSVPAQSNQLDLFIVPGADLVSITGV
jgi:hypothetical protein